MLWGEYIGPMSSCCDEKPKVQTSCCPTTAEEKKRPDYFFWSVFSIGLVFYIFHLANSYYLNLDQHWTHLPHHFFTTMNTMAWGVALGIIFVGLLGNIPREYILSVIGTPFSRGSLVKATAAGVALDLCSHGILMVGMKLYERGASIGQVMAFLIASPWNSLSLTLILIALIGLKWTLLFILGSAIIAIISGWIFDRLVLKGVLPANPHSLDLPEDFHFWSNLKTDLKKADLGPKTWKSVLVNGLKDSKMILKWLFFGAILAATIQTYVDTAIFKEYFGPSFIGMAATLFFATVIEVCSEGSAPIAADLFSRASAPGNAFTFLMAGMATDYTEIMVLKDRTKSWKIALFLPLVTVPQVLVLAYLMNQF